MAGGIGKVVYAALTGAAPVAAILGTKVLPPGEVTEETEVPYAEYTVTGNVADKSLEGTLLGYDAEVSILLVTATYAQCQDLLRAVAKVFDDGLSGTIAGIVVEGSAAIDASDEPNGPIDRDDAEVFEGNVVAGIRHKG